MAEKTIHEGRNVKRIREILGIKQDALAMDIGLSQQAVSALEQKEALDKDMLEKIARALKVTPDAIRNYNHEATVNIIANECHDQSASVNYYPTYNNDEKWPSLLEENKKLAEENKKLYLELLKEKDDKIALLEKMLDKK